MIESNDNALHNRPTREVPARSRRRKSAKWKSGLMLTGLGAVVLGAGYIAGVNAPAVAGDNTTQSVAQAGVARPGASENSLLAPQNSANPNDSQGFVFNGDDGEQVFGDQGLQGDDGTFLFNGGDGSSSSSQFNQQFGGRRSRQSGGLGQQQPNFGGPVTRSRGS